MVNAAHRGKVCNRSIIALFKQHNVVSFRLH
jgi:hypothetical protein